MDLITATLLGAIASIVGGILSGPFIIQIWDRYSSRIRTKRIVDPDDDDLESLCELQLQLFPDELADSYDDMRRWVQEVALARNTGRADLDDIILVLKIRAKVFGYIYSQYYRTTRFLFISYIAIDSSLTEVRNKGAQALLKALLKECEKLGHDWRGIFGLLPVQWTPS